MGENMVSRKTRDDMMNVICDYYKDGRTGGLYKKYLYENGFENPDELRQTVDILCSMGYITQDNLHGIQLTFLGKCYFEREADKSREKRVENIRYIITTSIALAAFIKSFFF